jgi:hypothetical protein
LLLLYLQQALLLTAASLQKAQVMLLAKPDHLEMPGRLQAQVWLVQQTLLQACQQLHLHVLQLPLLLSTCAAALQKRQRSLHLHESTTARRQCPR